MTSGPCQETSCTAITLNPESNFARPEKNHSLFHWHTLTYPELQEHIWMLCLSAALTTVGTSMDQEICLILGQVSPSLLCWKRNLQERYMSSGERLTKRQATSRADHLWPEIWIKLGRNAKLKEKQKWSDEKPKLDNARRLRGIYFIDFEDKEFKETIKNARKKLETPVAPDMLCKTSKKSKNGETRSKTNNFKSKFACILEASESTRLHMEESLPNYCEDHIAGRGDNSLQHCNLVHKIYSYASNNEETRSKAAVDKEWEKLAKIPAWNLTKVRSKSVVIDEARTKGATVNFASLMDICHLKSAELEAKHQKYEGQVVLRRDIVKDNSGSYAVFTEQGSSASQMTAAKIMDIISRLPGCSGQAADAVSAHTHVKLEDAPKLLKIP